MNIELDKNHKNVVSIRVVGVSGGGGNAVDHMCSCGIGGVEFVSVNTDLLALRQSSATYQLNIGTKLTQGMGREANRRSTKSPPRRAERKSPLS